MGLVTTQTDDDYEDDSPVVPTDYYWGQYKSANFYTNNDGDQRVALQFTVEYEDTDEDVEVELPFFAPAKVSAYSNNSSMNIGSSKLGSLLEGMGLIEIFDQIVGADGAITGGEQKFLVEDGEDEAAMDSALAAAFSGKKFYLNVERSTNDDGEESNLITGIDRFESIEEDEEQSEDVEEVEDEEEAEEEEGAEEEEIEGDEEEDVLFGEDEDEEVEA